MAGVQQLPRLEELRSAVEVATCVARVYGACPASFLLTSRVAEKESTSGALWAFHEASQVPLGHSGVGLTKNGVDIRNQRVGFSRKS